MGICNTNCISYILFVWMSCMISTTKTTNQCILLNLFKDVYYKVIIEDRLSSKHFLKLWKLCKYKNKQNKIFYESRKETFVHIYEFFIISTSNMDLILINKNNLNKNIYFDFNYISFYYSSNASFLTLKVSREEAYRNSKRNNFIFFL